MASIVIFAPPAGPLSRPPARSPARPPHFPTRRPSPACGRERGSHSRRERGSQPRGGGADLAGCGSRRRGGGRLEAPDAVAPDKGAIDISFSAIASIRRRRRRRRLGAVSRSAKAAGTSPTQRLTSLWKQLQK